MNDWLKRWQTPSSDDGELTRCRQELETCRRLLQSDEVRTLRAACEALQSDLAACEQEKERLQYRLGYLAGEVERLQALAAEQQDVIARQQARLADLMPEG